MKNYSIKILFTKFESSSKSSFSFPSMSAILKRNFSLLSKSSSEKKIKIKIVSIILTTLKPSYP